MGNQKIINLLIDSGSQPSGFATKRMICHRSGM